MKVTLALDAVSTKTPALEQFLEVMGHFQSKGLIASVESVSAFHPGLLGLRSEYYRRHRSEVVGELMAAVKKALGRRWPEVRPHVVFAESPGNEDLVEAVASWSRRHGNEVVAVAGHQRRGLAWWVLGSFSETAAMISPQPVLVVKPTLRLKDLHRTPRFVLCVDPEAPPSKAELTFVQSKLGGAGRRIDVLTVRPRRESMLKSFLKETVGPSKRSQSLARVIRDLSKRSEVRLVEKTASSSVAAEIADYACSKRAWMVILTSPARSRGHRLLMGSTARSVLALAKTPVLALRNGS